MLAAFSCCFAAIVFSIILSGVFLLQQLQSAYRDAHPGYEGNFITEFSGSDASAASLLTDMDIEKISIRFLLFLMITSFGSVFLIILLFVRRLRKKIVHDLEHFDHALLEIPDLAEKQVITEIHSDLLEFDRVCERVNHISTKLLHSEQERQRLEAQQRKWLADISHDLKTPITVIQGYAKALHDDIADKDLQNKYLDAIYHKSESVAELIHTFHRYSKLNHPDYQFDLKQDDLCEYFREYLAGKYRELELAGFDMEADIPDDAIFYAFDHSELCRVFENIISNTIRHNEPGTVIFAKMQETDQNILIELGDSGTGIPEAIRDQIFEPFVTGSEARTQANGSGLGLAISKRIIEAHGGTISLIESPDARIHTLYQILFPKQSAEPA